MAAGAACWLSMCLLAGPVSAEDGCRSDTTRLSTRATVNVRIDNDMFGGMGQDQGYSNGFLVSAVSPNLADYTDDPCLPRPARRLNRHLAWLQPDGFDEQNMIFGVGQLLYTPTDRNRTDLIADDRPYAAALLLSFGYNARKGDRLRTTQLRLGMVGPSAFGEQVQNRWHDVIGSDRFDGWDHQLRDEPVLQLIHERRKRLGRRETPGGWGWDLTRHWGGSLGNFATYANVGGEWRFGARLPDDFGTAPLRPAGENTSPVKEVADRRWHGHVFVAVDARWVLHDITLDGNTFKSSHSVDKRPMVADIGYGVARCTGGTGGSRWRATTGRGNSTARRTSRSTVRSPSAGTSEPGTAG